jgi:hypothetical protein
MIAEAIYIACAITCAGCAWLLFRGYWRGGPRLLLWAGLCFVALTLDNVILYVDIVVLPAAIDLFYYRTVTAAVGMIILLYGLVEESR